MNELKIFENPDFGAIRTVEQNGEPWFVAADVCRALDIVNHKDAVTRLDDDEKSGVVLTDPHGREQLTNCVNEPGLYSLVLGSRKPEAKAFKRWITHEVIPTIRKHGAYMTPDVIEKAISEPDTIIQLLQALKEERVQRIQAQFENDKLNTTVAVQQQQIAEMQPKSSYFDVIINCKDLVAVSTIAKDYGWSARKLNGWLKEQGVQFKRGDIWLLYQKYAAKGYTQTKTSAFPDQCGELHSRVHTYWTQKGRLFLYDLLKKHDILPLIERTA